MGNKHNIMLHDDEIAAIKEETCFTERQIEKLYARFVHLDRTHSNSLSRDDLLSIPELAANPLADRIVHAFFAHNQQNQLATATAARSHANNFGERIDFKQFARALAVFNMQISARTPSSQQRAKAPPQTASKLVFGSSASNNSERGAATVQVLSASDAQYWFVFNIYDCDQDGRVSFGDLRDVLKLMVGAHIEDGQLDKISTRAFVEIDQDGDGFVEFHEFNNNFALKHLEEKLRVKYYD